MTRFDSVVLGAVAIVTAAGCGSISMETPATSAPVQSSPAGSQATTAPVSMPTFGTDGLALGSSQVFPGESSEEEYRVTVSSVVDPATESDGLGLLNSGDRLVAVRLTVANVGSGIEQDSIADHVTLVYSGGYIYEEADEMAMYSVSECKSFSATSTLAPNQSVSGCVVFQIPSGAVLSQLQYGAETPLGDAFAQWNLG
jgi:hypothetical protein